MELALFTMAESSPSSNSQLLSRVKEKATELGFELFGIARAQEAPGFKNLAEWIDRGYAATMEYIPKRLEAYQHPRHVLDGCQSVMMLALPYQPNDGTFRSKSSKEGPKSEASIMPSQNQFADTKECQLASYASGRVDYHDLIWRLLKELTDVLLQHVPESMNRGIVDTAPLLERDFAMLAGLGWIGKNTLLLNRRLGSYFFLAAILTDLVFEQTTFAETDHCGSCTACLEACPTNAFPQPRVLDASRCISYLTIEHRGLIDEALSEQMEDWLFGCDVCQMVCPWNRKPQNRIHPDLVHLDMARKQTLQHWLEMDDESFRRLYRDTPFWRTKLEGMQRNALIVAANTRRYDLRGNIQSLAESKNEVVRETALQALSVLDRNAPT
jgi:epoxyqueuosine reductase